MDSLPRYHNLGPTLCIPIAQLLMKYKNNFRLFSFHRDIDKPFQCTFVYTVQCTAYISIFSSFFFDNSNGP
jgi:hypothetical protein